MRLTDNKGLSIFLIKLLGVYFSWKGIIYILGKEETPLNERIFPLISKYWEYLNNLVRLFDLKFGELVLKILNYDVLLYSQHTIYIKGHYGIMWGNYCIGFQLSYYFTMLVLIAPLKLNIKLTSIIAGFLLLRLLNNFRMVGMNLISYYIPEYLELSHHYLFNVIVLIILLLFYYYLITNFSKDNGVIKKQ